MKKLISLILCAAISLSYGTISAFALEDNNDLILFVTGIGQSYTYLFEEKYLDDDIFENGDLHTNENYTSLIENGDTIGRWNLINGFDIALKNPSFVTSFVLLISRVIFSLVCGKRILTSEDIHTFMSKFLKNNTIDENGKLADNIITPQHPYPLSEYPYHYDEKGNKVSEAKSRFYSSIPCAEAAEEKFGKNYEDHLYCFNYSSFSFTSENVKALHKFIETILKNNKIGARKVVLVPMSMGASVVSAYLNEYPDVSDNHVSKVVSIVGCWNGSDLVTDLINLDYADNSADMFYNTLLPSYISKAISKSLLDSEKEISKPIYNIFGESSGYMVLLLLRLLPKAELRFIIDEALDSIGEFILSTPSLLALVPSYDYPSIRERIPEGKVREEADNYYKCQLSLINRMKELEKQGVTFSFISAYGSTFGGVTDDYNIFGFLASAPDTNSDEIINISSTAPGTSYTAYNKTFNDEAGRILSQDKTIDISTTYYKDSTWFFYKEMHDLKYNNTALRLAVKLATGEINTIYDCDNPEDKNYFPQFNAARDIYQLNSDIKKINEYALKAELSEEQKAILNKAIEMKYCTVNNPESDKKIADDLHNMLIEMNLENSNKTNPNKTIYNLVSFINKAVDSIFGPKGYFD